jgi:hypothetical protein
MWDSLESRPVTTDCQAEWDSFYEAVADAIEAAVPTRRVCSRSQRWWTEELDTARKRRNVLRRRLAKGISVRATAAELAAANRELAELVQEAKQTYFARLQETLCSQKLPHDIYKGLN